MTQRITKADLHVSACLANFIDSEVLPGTNIHGDHFWASFSEIVHSLSDENRQLLNKRDALQESISQWHRSHQTENFNFLEYKSFLQEINYLETPVSDFSITTQNVDDELASLAGPQLVVPIMNARFALNAVNARWGSLYDALYGSDVIDEANGSEQTKQYNPARGKKVIIFAKEFLDKTIPLLSGSHADVVNYEMSDTALNISLNTGETTQLACAENFKGFSGTRATPESLLFAQNGLHFEIKFDAKSPIGQSDSAGISDILIEAALTTIMDCEDSVAAVDAEDKVIAYRNWLGLMQGSLKENMTKNGKSFVRSMNDDRQFLTITDEPISVRSRSLMFVRNVGHLMTNDAILDKEGNEIPEGILDAMITSTIALHDIKGVQKNSKKGSIYIVKPKMHGPEEVKFADTLFAAVETALSLPKSTIKMGIMDEERRTSINLKNCIHAAKDRVVFINTGFLDRTGDEIHTSMEAGPMAHKADIKFTPWISAYEDNNVDVGLACGFSGKAQIGKGMWPIPDQMANMLATKINHVEAGANTAWVPSPTAAVLHALHYHRVNVFELQKTLSMRTSASVDDILTIPLAEHTNWTASEIEAELDNNAQGILGYVVRWIDQGIGCSKVPDINDVGLMEDRATLRISSQHLANWLKHNICSEEQVMASMKKMAKVVDQQNSHDKLYHAMSSNFDNNIAFKAACQLVFEGESQPNGYTEPLLHEYRKLKKIS